MDEIVVRNTTTNATFFTVTDLLPGTTYELTVVAVSQGGDIIAMSEPSGPETATTDVTGQWCVSVLSSRWSTNKKGLWCSSIVLAAINTDMNALRLPLFYV